MALVIALMQPRSNVHQLSRRLHVRLARFAEWELLGDHWHLSYEPGKLVDPLPRAKLCMRDARNPYI